MANQNYSIRFINNSNNAGSACVFQQTSDMGYNTFPLAWFARFTPPGSQVSFNWSNEYSFVWGSPGQLMPGVTFNAAQSTSADPNGQNRITLTGGQGNYQFINPTQGGQPGTLAINTDYGIQPGQVSVGIGMSGGATFACGAQGNMLYNFNTNVQYCVAFGNFQQGQVLDPGQMSNSARIEFPSNVYAMTVTLNPDGSFMVQPS